MQEKEKKILSLVLSFSLMTLVLSGCGQGTATELNDEPVALAGDAAVGTHVTATERDALAGEAAALTQSPAALPQTMTAVASGTAVEENDKACIDYSNAKEGYVMVRYNARTTQRLKVQVKGPTTTYTYNLGPGMWESLPLSDGNGSYQIKVYQNVKDNKYACVLSLTTDVTLVDEFAPFLHSNQYVDFDAAPETVKKAAELTIGLEQPLEQVAVIYDYVVRGMTYDTQLAAQVKSGYLPVLDEVLEKKSGICFDYAALMTGMLRSRGIPCKLVVGYAGTVYHAWISVWSEQTGWVEGVVYFDGTTWQRMDPTFASSGQGNPAILAYIGDGENYSAKYFY